MKIELPKLKFELNALEPAISSEIMDLHYNKHHAGYINNFNKLVEQFSSFMADNKPADAVALQPLIKFNGGGALNHTFFWNILSPPNDATPGGALSKAINDQFGSFDAFKESFNKIAAAIPGSGWCWLVSDKITKRLSIITTPNQDTLCGSSRYSPLLAVDMWEHAYYLVYKNVRAEYLKNFWPIIDWAVVEKNFEI